MAQLLGIDFGLNDLRGVGHRAILQLVDALPVVDLGKKRRGKRSLALVSEICLVPSASAQQSWDSQITGEKESKTPTGDQQTLGEERTHREEQHTEGREAGTAGERRRGCSRTSLTRQLHTETAVRYSSPRVSRIKT